VLNVNGWFQQCTVNKSKLKKRGVDKPGLDDVTGEQWHIGSSIMAESNGKKV